MALIKCPDCGKEVSDIAPSCPNCGRPINLQNHSPAQSQPPNKKTSPIAMGCLVFLLIVFGLWVIGSLMSGGSSSKLISPSSTQQPSVDSGPQLELITYNWHTEHGYAILEGQVKNISSQSLKSVIALASFYDANSGFIASSDALIDYNPILPGQTSPFKVMKTENPAMEKARVEFKYLMGATIPFRRAEGNNGTKK